MDISAQIKKLAESRQGLEDQVKSLKGEIRDINVKIRKLETIARHAEDVLGDQVQIKDGPTDFPIGGIFGNPECGPFVTGALLVDKSALNGSSNGSSEG